MGVVTDKSLQGLTTAVTNISATGMSDSTGQAIVSAINGVSAALSPSPNIVSVDNTQSIEDNAYTSILSVNLSAGSWLITYHANFGYNVNGYRRILLSNTTNSNNDTYNTRITTTPAASGLGNPATNFSGSTIITLSSATTIYFVAYQSSGVSMSTTGNFRAVKL